MTAPDFFSNVSLAGCPGSGDVPDPGDTLRCRHPGLETAGPRAPGDARLLTRFDYFVAALTIGICEANCKLISRSTR